MFKFFKEKLKSFFKKSREEIEEKAEKEEAKEKSLIKEDVKKKKIKAKEKQKEEKKAEEEKKELLEEMPKKEGFFQKLKKRFETVSLDEETFEKIWHNLEIILIENNVAIAVIDSIKDKLKTELVSRELKKSEIENIIRDSIKKVIFDLLIEPFDILQKIREAEKPFVMVFFGINGSGKTTTIAKIANMLKKNRMSCVFAASDTFRAASIEQLQKHASKLNIPVVKHDYGADAAAVAYDAIAYAKSHSIDVVLVDTAGRMHTEKNLMREMEKICRVTKPDLKIFIGESIVGNDVIEQAKSFNSSVGIDAVILTKADVDERGGAAISIGHVTGKPIIYLATGQDYEDIIPFDKAKLLEQIGLS
jgi:fused signal recognition particle receptor